MRQSFYVHLAYVNHRMRQSFYVHIAYVNHGMYQSFYVHIAYVNHGMYQSFYVHIAYVNHIFSSRKLKIETTFFKVNPSSHTRLAFLEVVYRGLVESVLKPSIGVGTFKKDFFLFDPNLTSGMSATLMQGHCLRRRPCIKQHMSGGREFHRAYHRQLPPHLTRHETLHAAGLDCC